MPRRYVPKKQKRWYQWEKNFYRTLEDYSIGENISMNAARYRHKMGYKSFSDMKWGAPIEIDGTLYSNMKEAGKQKKLSHGAIRQRKYRERKKAKQ